MSLNGFATIEDHDPRLPAGIASSAKAEDLPVGIDWTGRLDDVRVAVTTIGLERMASGRRN